MMDPHDRDERAILSAYRDRERMPPAARDAAWARLQAALADEAPRARRVRWQLVVLLAAAVLLVIAGVHRVVASRAPVDDIHHAAPDHAEPARERGVHEPAPTRVEPAPVLEPAQPAVDPGDPPVKRRARPDPPAGPGLVDELALLRDARAALAAGAPARALELLGEHERGFAGGHLVEERLLLQVQGLCALGQVEPARAAAQRFLRTYPDSPHTSTVTAVCGE